MINLFQLPSLFNSIFSIVLCLIVVFKTRITKLTSIFLLLCLSTFNWQLCWFISYYLNTPFEKDLICRIAWTSIVFIPFLIFHFDFEIVEFRWGQAVITIGYVFAAIYLLLIWSGKSFLYGYKDYWWGYYPLAGYLFLFYASIVFCYIIGTFFLLLRESKNPKFDGKKRNQIGFVLFAHGFYYLASVEYLIDLGFGFFPIGAFFILASYAILLYAITRHRLMDIEVVIKKGFIYSVLMAAIIGVYAFIVFISRNFFQATLGINQWIVAVLMALAIATGYKPLENFIINITNQYFFRKRYDYQQTLKKSSEALNLLTDIDRLIRLSTRIVARDLNLEESSTLIYDEPNHKYIVKAAEGKSRELRGITLSDNYDLFKHLFHSQQILIKDELIHTLNSKFLMLDEKRRLNTIRKEMEKIHAQICIPSITRGKYMGNKLVAVFCLGEKKSGDMYSNEDIQLLSTLSNQAAVAVENAIMYSDLMKQFQELKETKDQLIQSEKLAALGTMAAGIAHEIKNPLTSLQLFTQMMAERFDDHEFREKFTQIVPPEIERLNRIVNDLVSFAKPSKLTREPSQINDILEKIIRLSEMSFKKLNVKVVKEFSEVPNVLADSQQIMQIFLNLIMNGAQAMAKGGTLTVKTYYDDIYKKVCIDVKDTGLGISEENMKKIFAPFFSTKEGGTGLGLAITKRIIEEHKGEIKVKSKVGEGTTFTVELPVAA